MEQLHQILNLTHRHNLYMQERVDLIASNSWVSEFARLTMCSLLANNYCIGLPGNRLYSGCAYIDMIEREVVRLVHRLFGMKHAVVQFLSGMQANIGAFNAILEPGDTVLSAPTRLGGHYSHNAQGPLRFFAPRIVPIPFDDARYNVDVERLAGVMEKERPKLLILGWSEFLFPHPLAEIRELCDRNEVRLMYDMSHVAGLIAGKVFQPDVSRYADVITSSTGKSLHAPDHGMVLFNDQSLMEGVLDAVMPLLTSNTHPHEMAAVGVALAEAERFGGGYAGQVVSNSKALAVALHERGLKVLYGDLGYTESHTILVEFPAPDIAVSLLDRAGLLCNACELPWDREGQATGLRFGTQVVTRRGMKEPEMERIAEAISNVLVEYKNPDRVAYEIVYPLGENLDRAAFSFDFHFPAEGGWYDAPYRGFQVKDAVEILGVLLPFANCTVEEIEGLVDVSRVLMVDKEVILFEAGAPADAVFFISSGVVEVVDRSGEKEIVIASLGEGSHVGELGVMTGHTRRYDVRVKDGSRLLHMQGDDFKAMLQRLPRVREYFDKYVASHDPVDTSILSSAGK